MTDATEQVNADPLTPARSQADWDAQGWAHDPEPAEVAPRLATTISIRFDPDSAALLRRAARIKGVTKSEFVRQATLHEARKAIDETPLPVSMWLPGQQELASTSGSGGKFVTRTSLQTVYLGRFTMPGRDAGDTQQPVTTTRLARELVPG